MIYFYHHYELPYVVQQNQLQQVIIQRQQEQHQHQHHHHPFTNGAGRGGGAGTGAGGGGVGGVGGGEGRRGTTAGGPADRGTYRRNVGNQFSIMNGLHHLGRLRATLLRRRRVRTFDASPPPQPPAEGSSPSLAVPDDVVPDVADIVDVSGGVQQEDAAVPVFQ